MEKPEIIHDPDIARRLESFNRHLEFAEKSVEQGWNARDDRGRAFNFTAALATIKGVMLEQQFLIDRLYAQSKLTKQKGTL